MKHDSSIDAMVWLRTFRHRIVKMLLGSLSVLATLGIVYIMVTYIQPGKRISPLLIAYFSSYLFLLILLFASRIPVFWRGLGFLSLLFGFAVFSFYNGWLGGGGRTFLLPFIILSAILINPKAGLHAAGLSLVTFAGFGIAYHQGWLTYELAPSFAEPPIIIVEGVGFSMAVGMTSIALWFFREALTAANQATQEANTTRSTLAERAQQLDTANQLLAEQAKHLEIANKNLESFSYSVSHDLRAPLRVIDSFSEILEQEYASQIDEEGRDYISRIRKNAQNMTLLIDDLLDFSRLDRQEVRRKKLDLAEIVREVLVDYQPELAGRQVEVTVESLPVCRADPSLMRQVYANLIGNAIKYTRPRELARIEIGCLSQGGETVYYIQDNGVGFDMQYADKLFTVFQRLHHASEFEGTGVGLATVQRILQRHGGRIWCQAEVDNGAAFFFTLES